MLVGLLLLPLIVEKVFFAHFSIISIVGGHDLMWIVDLCSLLMMFTHLNYEGIKNPPEIPPPLILPHFG